MFRKAAVFIAMFTVLLAFGASGVAAGGGCIPAAGKPTEGSGQAVSIKSCLFGPAILHAPVGGTIVWTNDDFVPHAVAGAGWSANSDAYGMFNPGASVQHTFDTAGIYAYMCHLHPGMAGLVIVGDVAFPPVAPPTIAPQNAGAAVKATPAAAAPLDALLTGALVLGSALAGFVFARWPRRWRPSALAIRAALADRRDPGVRHDELVELPVGDDRDLRADRTGHHDHAVARGGADV